MAGYSENFLKVRVPMPKLTADLGKRVLKQSGLRNGIYADHITYTVITDKVRRAPIVVAANIDQNQFKKTKRSSKWFIDSAVGTGFQLNNDYYKDFKGIKNPWDRGHLAMREQAGWGPSQAKAQQASDDTFFYSNASLQHCNYNPDEWYQLEQWVGELNLDMDGRITCFSGPIYGEFSRTVTPPKRGPAEVPVAFFKAVCFVGKAGGTLDVRAFIVVQDEGAIADRQGHKMYNIQSYQSTVKEIQDRTGLLFAPEIAEKNPLLYYDKPERRRKFGISHFPERIEVDRPEEIVDGKGRRVYSAEDEVEVYIAAALPSPSGNRGREWISIINLEKGTIHISKWTSEVLPHYSLKKPKGHEVLHFVGKKSGSRAKLGAGESLLIEPISPLRLPDVGATIVLKDGKGRRIDRVKYSKRQVTKGEPVILFERQADLKVNKDHKNRLR